MRRIFFLSVVVLPLLGWVGSAQAGLVATSYLNVRDFGLVNAATGAKLRVDTANPTNGDLVFVGNVVNDGDTRAFLNGSSDSNANQAPVSAAGLDVDFSCVGQCGTYAENDFTFIQQPNDANGTYSRGDALLTGAIFDIDGTTPSASAQTLAEVSLASGNNIGTSRDDLGTTGQIQFTANATLDVRIDYVADVYIRALLSSDLAGVDANATISFSVDVLGIGNDLDFTYAPRILNGGRSATVPGDDFLYQLTNYTDPDAAARLFSVVAGNQYQLTIDLLSEVNGNAISDSVPAPAPATLALLGLGLLGVGYRRRQRG